MKNYIILILLGACWMLAAGAQEQAPDGDRPAGPEAQPSHRPSEGTRAYFVQDFTDGARLERLSTDDVELTERGVELSPAAGLQGVRAGQLRSSVEAFELAANAVTMLWKANRPPGTDIQIEISVSRDGINWERWYTVEKDPHAAIREHYPDGRPNPNHGFVAGSLLSWGLERYEFFRYRVTLASGVEASPSVTALRLFYQDSTLDRVANPPEKADEVPRKAGGVPQPSICDRTCWAARAPQCTIDQLTGISRGVIHHTASQTDWDTTSEAESAARVRAHQNFHMDGNGWCDIGYHFLADKLGNRFEGREGSLAGTPRGAHDGTNQDSIGVSLMGYLHSPHNQVPTQAMRDAAYDLIAWKVEDPFDGYDSGTYGALSDVGFTAGHRDVSSTSCPGEEMYDTYIGTDFFGGDARDGINNRVTGGGGTPCCPGPPTLSSVISDGNGDSITVSWSDVGTVANYHVYTSTDGTTFGSPVVVASGTTSYTDVGIGAGQERYYQVTAVGSSQESSPSDVYGAVSDVAPPVVLIVDGNDRWNFQSGENPSGANHAFATYAAAAMAGTIFDTVDNDQVENGTVSLSGYDAVVWLLGEESTAQESFSGAEQNAVSTYLDAGGDLFVSGAEIGWDLVAQGSTADQTFYESYLKAVYVADDAGTYDAESTAGGIFDGIGSMSFSGGLMDIGYPDQIDVSGGSELALSYVGGGQNDVAGVSYDGTFRVVNMGFPFESVNDPVKRSSIMGLVLDFFSCTVTESPEASCSDGVDNDCDGLTDAGDPDCTCVIDADCTDGLFCNGAEVCNAGSCDPGTAPCSAGETCDEDGDLCVGDGPVLWMSFRSNTAIPSVGTVADEDIVSYDETSGTWALEFDGSDVGLGSLEISGLAILPSGNLLLSFTAAGTVGGLSVDDSDIVEFTPTSMGSTTAGSFSMYFDGSDVALTSNGEDVDGIAFSGGNLVVSSTGGFSGTGGSGSDEDLMLFTGTLGENTSGSFTKLFDGSDVELGGNSAHDVDAAAFIGGNLLFSTVGNIAVTGVSGADEDVVEFAGTFGGTTSGSYSMRQDLSALGIAANEDIGSLHVIE